MPWLWSNPVPDQHTSADLSAGYKVDAANIGPLVGAILRYREAQQQQQQKQLTDMISGIGKGISGVAGGIGGMQSQGAQNDAANASIYGMQYPQDAMGGFTNPDVVPDYGGTDALKALQYAKQIDPNYFSQTNQPPL